MNRKILSVLICLFTMVLVTATTGTEVGPENSRWVALNSADTGSEPVITVMHSNQEHTIVDVELPGFWVSDREAAGSAFQEVTVPGHTTTMEIGKPALPVIRFLVAVPSHAHVAMSYESDHSVTLDGYLVYPFQEPQTDAGLQSIDFTIDESTYRSSDPFPTTVAAVSDPSMWRHLRVVQVELTPASYVPDKSLLSVTSHFTVELRYQPENADDVLENTRGVVKSHWEKLYQRHIVNYDWIETEEGLRNTVGPVYLIVTHPNFESAIQPLADWHHREGLETEVVSISTSSAQTIKNTISDRYDQGNLEYVLLVGDVNYIPYYTWGGSLSDYWYSCLTGSPDNYADVTLGRLSVTSSSQTDDQVEKILAYEKNPPLDDWLTDVILLAHREDAPGKYVACKEFIRNSIIPQPPHAVETAYGHQPAGTNSNIAAAINDGCNIVNYRGHGATSNWWQWDYNWASWTTSNVNSLSNGDRTPVVFNIACDNHKIQNSCLGETWLRKNPGGAVASLGATMPSYTTPNHDYDKEIFRQFGMYDEYRIGLISNAAATYIINHHGSWGIDNARMYLWLGDPATEIWTAIPEVLSVDHPSSILTGQQTLDVTVTDGGDPVQGATVCLYKTDEIYEVSTTGANGIASFSITPATAGILYVTTSQHDYLPYEGETTVLEFVPNMALTLTADASSFPRDSDMGYTVQGTNYEGTPQTVDYWADVFLPNGNPFAGNPVFGPVTVTIPAGASPSAHLSHYIPSNTPLWTFTYKGYIGIYPSQVWYEDNFNFTVTE
jgi:hypothetical protein